MIASIERMPLSRQLILLIGLVLLTRVPFLFDGFGVEEDSWGLVVNAQEMHDADEYRASRFPGHPLQEYIYLLIWNQPTWLWNAMSVFFSLIAVICFHLALHKMQLNTALQVSLMLCFTSVFVLAGTYTIDYTWTLAFLMASFWLLCERRFWWSGVALGLAIGCRITSGVFLLPWLLLLMNRMDLRSGIFLWLRILVPAVIIGVLWYVPAYTVYGRTFFDYSDQFPYPPLTKVIFKATLGVFSITGLVALMLALFWGRCNRLQGNALFSEKRLLTVSILIVVLHIISYLRLPQKAGYMLPAVPWIVLIAGILVTRKQAWIVAALFIVSPFILGLNLTDSMRGSTHSALALKFNISGQELFLDPLSGSLQAERSKRINKMKYCNQILDATDTLKETSILISGWWYNELLITTRNRPTSPLAHFRFYASCSLLDSVKAKGNRIYFLSEQNIYNDQMYGQTCTDSLAIPFLQTSK
jgi:hypothetical protein